MIDDPTSTPGSQVPIPQPFSVLHDPVIKIDYRRSSSGHTLTFEGDSGIFNPMPAQAISRHIAQHCHPLPRVIVLSYVASDVTELVRLRELLTKERTLLDWLLGQYRNNHLSMSSPPMKLASANGDLCQLR